MTRPVVQISYVRSVAPSPDWRPRLVALDIDGTLRTDADDGVETVRPAVRDALDAVRTAGAHVVLCSGRSMLAVLDFVAQFGDWRGPAICSNGAVWLDTGTASVLRRREFELTRCVALVREMLPGAAFAAEEIGFGNRFTDGFGHVPFAGHNRLVDYAEFVATPTSRLTVYWPGRTAIELNAALAAASLTGELAELLAYVNYSVGEPDAWLYGSPAGVTKGSALAELCLRLGVSAAETLAIGDAGNDMEMLAWAAHGVAMGQAPAAVRAVADEVTASVAENGAALALNRWFRTGLESTGVESGSFSG